MFVVVRSVFWLSVAFMVIRPGVDLPDTDALAAQAMAAGSQVVSEQIERVTCSDMACLGAKTVVASVLQSALPDVQSSAAIPGNAVAPIPRPRPDWAG